MKKWLKRKKVPISELKEHACPNCDYVFTGHFCPNCGQSLTEFDRPFGFVFYDFLGNVVAFDSRLFKTIYSLILKPGHLTAEFFRGKRMSYAPPFRIFIFLSFLLFLMLQIATNKSLTNVLDYSFKDSAILNDSISLAELDSLGLDLQIKDELDSSKNVTFGFDIAKFSDQENMRASLLSIAGQLEERLKDTEDETKRRMLLKFIDICRSPDQLASRILKYLSWAFFLLLPVFALLLKLFYVRRKKNYIRHLVFSVHLHSFLFLLFFLIVSLNLIFSGGAANFLFWGLLFIPIYTILAMKHFYQQAWGKTVVKCFLISTIYNLIVFTAFGFVVYNAFSNL